MPSGDGPSGKTWPRWPVAPAAVHFGADHAVARCRVSSSTASSSAGTGEAGPARAAVVFRVAGEQQLPAGGAVIFARRLVLLLFAGEGPLGPAFAQDMVLLRRQPFAPFGFGQFEFVGHDGYLLCARRISAAREHIPESLPVDIRIMRRRLDHFHPFGQQRAEAGAALEHGVPAARLFVARPVDPAEVIRDRNLRGSRKIGQAHGRSGQPRAVVDQLIDVVEMPVRQLHRFAQIARLSGGCR